jgi:hypothetical protein
VSARRVRFVLAMIVLAGGARLRYAKARGNFSSSEASIRKPLPDMDLKVWLRGGLRESMRPDTEQDWVRVNALWNLRSPGLGHPPRPRSS